MSSNRSVRLSGARRALRHELFLCGARDQIRTGDPHVGKGKQDQEITGTYALGAAACGIQRHRAASKASLELQTSLYVATLPHPGPPLLGAAGPIWGSGSLSPRIHTDPHHHSKKNSKRSQPTGPLGRSILAHPVIAFSWHESRSLAGFSPAEHQRDVHTVPPPGTG
jgi:hypothetical protein